MSMVEELIKPKINAESLAEKSLSGQILLRSEAREILHWPDADILTLLAAAFRVRQAHFGRKVKLNYLVNIQSGVCPENCGYCSQSVHADVPVEKYKMLTPEEVIACAERAIANKASRVCMVASMRGPNEKDVLAVTEAVRQVKTKYPHLEICASLGLLQENQAERLGAAGVKAYNHNLNTSEKFYGEICQTHDFDDRVDTVSKAKEGGLSSCSGVLLGMGETEEDILDVAYKLRALQVDSIPVNFLIPFKGTKAIADHLTPNYCLKVLAMFRLLCPDQELRVAGGRELHLRTLQPMTLYMANSIFVGDYLTTEGQAPSMDINMIRDLGFEILGQENALVENDLGDEVSLTSREIRLRK